MKKYLTIASYITLATCLIIFIYAEQINENQKIKEYQEASGYTDKRKIRPLLGISLVDQEEVTKQRLLLLLLAFPFATYLILDRVKKEKSKVN